MIIEELPNGKPYSALSGMAEKVLGPNLPKVVVTPTNDICICDFVDCEYIETVFSDTGGDSYKQDFSDFLFKRFLATDSIQLFLQKDSNDIVELTDDTYGTLFDGFPDGDDVQQLYYGFVINWTSVFAAFGGGVYNLRVVKDILGNQTEETSRLFRLYTYSDIAADQTVKIVSVQNGNILGSEFDFTGLNWRQYVRIPGVFGNPVPVLETDRYQTQQKELRQIKDTMSREWTLKTKKINWEVAEKLIYNKLLANQILITDYKVKAEAIWRDIDVKPTEIEKPELSGTPDKIYNVTFVDTEGIFEKTNF